MLIFSKISERCFSSRFEKEMDSKEKYTVFSQMNDSGVPTVAYAIVAFKISIITVRGWEIVSVDEIIDSSIGTFVH